MRYGVDHPRMSLPTILDRYRAHIRKLLRYASVSVVSTATSLTVLGILVGLANTPAGWANVIATSIATVPSFELNRRWVWNRTDKRLVLRQVMPFAALSFTGLVLSTLTVHFAGLWTTAWGWGRLARTAAVGFTNVATFGALWVFQYLLCDRVLFRSQKAARPAPEPVAQGPEPVAQPEEWDLTDILEPAPSD